MEDPLDSTVKPPVTSDAPAPTTPVVAEAEARTARIKEQAAKLANGDTVALHEIAPGAKTLKDTVVKTGDVDVMGKYAEKTHELKSGVGDHVKTAKELELNPKADGKAVYEGDALKEHQKMVKEKGGIAHHHLDTLESHGKQALKDLEDAKTATKAEFTKLRSEASKVTDKGQRDEALTQIKEREKKAGEYFTAAEKELKADVASADKLIAAERAAVAKSTGRTPIKGGGLIADAEKAAGAGFKGNVTKGIQGHWSHGGGMGKARVAVGLIAGAGLAASAVSDLVGSPKVDEKGEEKKKSLFVPLAKLGAAALAVYALAMHGGASKALAK